MLFEPLISQYQYLSHGRRHIDFNIYNLLDILIYNINTPVLLFNTYWDIII